MRETVQYDKARFRELVVYVAERAGDDTRFGDTKFNKVLFHVDFRAYNRLGRAVTGATYQRLDFGPAARRLKPVRRELERTGIRPRSSTIATTCGSCGLPTSAPATPSWSSSPSSALPPPWSCDGRSARRSTITESRPLRVCADIGQRLKRMDTIRDKL